MVPGIDWNEHFFKFLFLLNVLLNKTLFLIPTNKLFALKNTGIAWLMKLEELITYARVVFCISVFLSEGIQMSLNGPFYPEEAEKKGLTQSAIGITTGAQSLARVIGCIIVMGIANAASQKYFFSCGAIGNVSFFFAPSEKWILFLGLGFF